MMQGLQAGSALTSQQQERNQQAQRFPVEQEERLLRLSKEKQELVDQQLERNLMRQAFSSQEGERAGKDEQQGLDNQAGKMYQLGQRLMAVNPAQGMAFIKEAQDVKRKAFENQSSMLSNKKAQMEINGEILSGINSQEDLDAALPELARNGMVVPKEFRTWGPEAAAKFKQLSRQSKTVRDGMTLDLSERRLKAVEDKDQHQKEMDVARKQHMNNMDQIARERLDKGKAYTALSGKQLETAMIAHSTLPEFDDLDSTADKVRASEDIDRRAYELSKSGMSPTQAQYAAEEEVVSRIKDGKYQGMADLLKAETKTAAVTWNDWYAKAKGANPNASEKELKDFFESKYGNH
jgi:hypothetical protein